MKNYPILFLRWLFSDPEKDKKIWNLREEYHKALAEISDKDYSIKYYKESAKKAEERAREYKTQIDKITPLLDDIYMNAKLDKNCVLMNEILEIKLYLGEFDENLWLHSQGDSQ